MEELGSEPNPADCSPGLSALEGPGTDLAQGSFPSLLLDFWVYLPFWLRVPLSRPWYFYVLTPPHSWGVHHTHTSVECQRDDPTLLYLLTHKLAAFL